MTTNIKRFRPCRTQGCTQFVQRKPRYSGIHEIDKEGEPPADGVFCRCCRRKKYRRPSLTIRPCRTRGCTYHVRTHVRHPGFSKTGVPLADGVVCWYCRRKQRRRSILVKPTLANEQARFWSKVDRSGGPSKCWPWLAGKDKDGYGKFWMINGRTIRAHRYAIGLFEPGSNSLDDVGKHSCDHPWCCNPAHINEGTQAQNQAEKVKRGRSLQGTKSHRAKIDEETALQIKKLRKQGFTYPEIANAFGLKKGHVYFVCKHTWKHLDKRVEDGR